MHATGGENPNPRLFNIFSVFLNYPAAWRKRQPPHKGEVKNKIGLY